VNTIAPDSGGNVLLLVLLALPVLGALAMYPLRRNISAAKGVAMGTALLEFVLVVVVYLSYSTEAAASGTRFQLEFSAPWIPAFGTHFAFGIDGIALVLIALTAFLVPGLMLFAWAEKLPEGRTMSGYFALLLATEATLIGVFTATDVFLFYVFFEAMLIPMYFLIGRFGGPNRQYASVKFFLYSLLGGLIMLASLIGLYVTSAEQLGQGTFTWTDLQAIAANTPTSTQIWLFLGFFVAFAIKAPMWPVHTWLPDAATEAKPATAVLLVGVLDKVGTFGMIRFCLQLFPEASKWATPVVIVLAVISVLYGALLAIGQSDIMRLIAYTSISHFGFIVLGIFALTRTGGSGSALYMLNHGFSTAALFLIAAMLVARRGSKRIPDFGGWQRVTPGLAGVFLVAGLSGLALPGLSSFVSEFLVLVGTFQRYRAAAVIATAGIVLAALYILLMYKRMMTGPEPDLSVAGESTRPLDITLREKVVVAPLIAAFLVLGFYPKPVLDVLNPAVDKTLQYVGVTDPAPTVPTTADGSAK
jgi:NADH-quinone oxidoreductase subunit M